MLQKLRENTQGWIAWLIVIILIIPFAFWGISQYADTGATTVAATVNGEDITIAEVEQGYQQRYNQLAQLLGDQMSPDLINAQALRMDVLEQIILRELVEQQVRELGFRPSNEELKDSIRNIEAFQVDGQFDAEQYRRALAYAGYTNPQVFENSQRRDLAIQQLQRGLSESAFATPLMAAFDIALRDQGRMHEAVQIPASRFRAEIEIADADVSEYYESHSDQYLTRETVDIEYVTLSKAAFATADEVDEAQLREYYDQQMSDYASQEQRRARHILIEGDDEAALQKANEILARIKGGESFEALAREYSADTISAEEGGDLGFVERGQLVGPFEDTLFSMAAGETSEPVLTDFGYHLIRLDEIRAPEMPAFEEVREQLAADYLAEQSENAFEDAVQQLTEIVYEDAGSLGGAADEFDLTIQSVKGVARDAGMEIAANADVRSAIFSESVLEERNNSRPLRVGEDEVVVLRVVERYPAEPKPMAEVADEIRQLLVNQRASEQARELAETVHARALAGESLAAIAEELKLEYRPAAVTLRGTPDVTPAFLESLFAAPYPTEEAPVIEVTDTNSTDFAVFRLIDVKPGEFATLTATEQQARIEQLQRRQANTDIQAYLRELRESADVRIFENNIQQ